MSQVALFLRTVAARAYPRVIGMVRQPSWIFQEALMPILSVSAFAYIYRALGAPEKYVGFVVLGGAMTAFWLNVLWSMGAQLYWERSSGNLELYVMSPAPLMAVLAGMAVGGMAMTCVRAAVILATGILLFDVPFSPSSWFGLIGVFLLTLLALYGLGMMFASVFLLWGREAWHLVNLLQEPVYLLTGMNFPLKVFPTAVATCAAIIPLTAGMDAMRQLLFDAEGFWPVGVEVALLAVLSVAFVAGARALLAYLERLSREEGRITVKWQ